MTNLLNNYFLHIGDTSRNGWIAYVININLHSDSGQTDKRPICVRYYGHKSLDHCGKCQNFTEQLYTAKWFAENMVHIDMIDVQPSLRNPKHYGARYKLPKAKAEKPIEVVVIDNLSKATDYRAIEKRVIHGALYNAMCPIQEEQDMSNIQKLPLLTIFNRKGKAEKRILISYSEAQILGKGSRRKGYTITEVLTDGTNYYTPDGEVNKA